MKVPGGILLTIIGVSIVGLIFDPNVHFSGIFAMPSLSDGGVIPRSAAWISSARSTRSCCQACWRW